MDRLGQASCCGALASCARGTHATGRRTTARSITEKRCARSRLCRAHIVPRSPRGRGLVGECRVTANPDGPRGVFTTSAGGGSGSRAAQRPAGDEPPLTGEHVISLSLLSPPRRVFTCRCLSQ